MQRQLCSSYPLSTIDSLFDLDVAHHAHRLGIVVLIPVVWIEAGHSRKDLVREHIEANGAHSNQWLELFDHFAGLQLGHEHVRGADTADVRCNSEEKGVPTGLSVENTEFLTVREELGVLLNVGGTLKANSKSELLLSLNEFVNIVHGARFLTTEHLAHVVPRRHALRQVAKRVHFSFLLFIKL